MSCTQNQQLIFAALFFATSAAWCADDRQLNIHIHRGNGLGAPLLENRGPRQQRMVDENAALNAARCCLKKGCRFSAHCVSFVSSATTGAVAMGAGVGLGKACSDACSECLFKWLGSSKSDLLPCL